jgi:hypothetical protein
MLRLAITVLCILMVPTLSYGALTIIEFDQTGPININLVDYVEDGFRFRGVGSGASNVADASVGEALSHSIDNATETAITLVTLDVGGVFTLSSFDYQINASPLNPGIFTVSAGGVGGLGRILTGSGTESFVGDPQWSNFDTLVFTFQQAPGNTPSGELAIVDNIVFGQIPEPSTFMLSILGLLWLARIRWGR